MKQIVRYRFMTIPSKLTGEIKLTIDSSKNNEYSSQYEGGISTNIGIYPVIWIGIVRPHDDGRANWDPNDSIGLTKFSLPVFIRELDAIENSMKIPTMFSYTNNRLELNEKEAKIARRAFVTSPNTTVELSPIVIKKDENEEVEGIRLKINLETNTVDLTLNEFCALSFALKTLPVDVLTLQLYTTFVNRLMFAKGKGPVATSQWQRPMIDMTQYMMPMM